VTVIASRKLLGIGIAGAVVAAICCRTPALGILFGAVGLSAWLAWSDYVVMPALIAFAGVTAYGWVCLGKLPVQLAPVRK
jgi:mercuric ion transport protein